MPRLKPGRQARDSPVGRRRPARLAVAAPRARDALVLERQIVGDRQPALGGELTQRGGLASDRLLARRRSEDIRAYP
jgi:hypothetical protein